MRRLAILVVAACGSDGAKSPDAAVVDAKVYEDAFVPPFDAIVPDGSPALETCTNGVDDDHDGSVDCADADCSATAHCTPAAHTIQELQDGTVASGKRAIVDQVFVTAVRLNASGSVIAFLQEPDGVSSGGHTYPEYAGVQLFASAADTSAFPGLRAIQVGDCISLTATVIEFQGDTELLSPIAFAPETTSACGAMPVPFAGAFAALATDTDPATMGDQVGASAEVYEGVLVKVSGVTALTGPDSTSTFQIIDNGGGATMLVGNFIYQPGIAATAGQTFTSITGIYAQRTRYTLLPRTAADAQ